MIDQVFYDKLTRDSIGGQIPEREISAQVLSDNEIELLPLLNAAYTVRKKFVGNDVTIHIINNAQNGHCPEDCHYCAQAKSSNTRITEYPMKTDEEILLEAEGAYKKGAHRYCMVFAGRGPSEKRIQHLTRLIRDIKSRYPIEVCVSAGLLDETKAQALKDAGLDRMNHNLNTSAQYYPRICTTHTYQDRLKTLHAARKVGLQICSGVILGMGENMEDIIDMALTLRDLNAESIPVNFFMPIEGAQLFALSPKGTVPFGDRANNLSPEYCLRVLCLFRFLNPKAEIRIAAGRERYLRSMEVMALYPANSLFLDGYLNAKGEDRLRTYQMIKDAGFTIRADVGLDELIKNENTTNIGPVDLKDLEDLRPQMR